MRRLGLVGGTTWHSTAVYYKLLNEGVQAELGGVASCDLVLASLNFAEIAANNLVDISLNEPIVVDAAVRLKAAGAEGLMLCANTMHLYAEACASATGLPVIHIVDAVADACKARDFRTVALLGTRYTMEMGFFRDRLASLGVAWLIPSDEDREFINESIFGEMARGEFTDSTRARYVSIISELAGQGAEAAILGCTELPILIRPDDVALPTIDTTAVHVAAALQFALT